MEQMQFRAKDFRRIARDKLQKKWWLSLAVSLVAGILGAFGGGGAGGSAGGSAGGGSAAGSSFSSGDLDGVIQSVQEYLSNPAVIAVLTGVITVSVVISIALLLVGAPTLLGHCSYYTQLCNNENPQFSVLFSRFSIFWKAVGLRLFMWLFIFLWSLLLIVPGIIASYRYALAPYLMAQHPEMGIRQAVDESKRLMAGHKGRLFCLHLSFIGWALLALLTFGIGFLFLNPYMYAAEAAFYLDRTGQGIPLNPTAA